MAVNRRSIPAPRHEVYEVLLDPECYVRWVVGAKAVRGIDDEWPSPGAAFYHRSGVAVAEIKDKTELVELVPQERIVLRAFVRPFGVARVILRLDALGPARTLVTMHETPEPGTKLKMVDRVIDPLIFVRNVESLRRLERLVEEARPSSY